jgi:hypothetical protein
VLYELDLNPKDGPNSGEYISDAACGFPRSMSSDNAKNLKQLERRTDRSL